MTNREAIEILSVIRRSPSVDLFNKLPNSDNIIELNYKGAFDLAIRALEERPQGELNEIQSGMLVCPFCGAMPHKYYKNFCPSCGADMRGDNNENND